MNILPECEVRLLDSSLCPKPRKGPRSSDALFEAAINNAGKFHFPDAVAALVEHVPTPVAAFLRRIVPFQAIGDMLEPETTLQAMNGKLFMDKGEGTEQHPVLNEISADSLKALFPAGQEADWPRQLVLCAKDIRPDPAALHNAMHNFPLIAGEILEARGGRLETALSLDPASARDKVVVIGVYHTDDNVVNNMASVMHRISALAENSRSMKGINPAAIAAGDAILGILAENGDASLLRKDAPDIMRHIMTHGYSQGGNIATDTFRHLRNRLLTENYRAAQPDGSAPQPITEANVGRVFDGSYILTFASVDTAYQNTDVTTLPPRDACRCKEDSLVNLAAGTNRQQRNYHINWQQDSTTPHRQDRLLEVLGPAKKDKAYALFASLAGHGDVFFRDAVPKQCKDLLKERLASRFQRKAVACDITFHDGMIDIDFDNGTPRAKMEAVRETLEKEFTVPVTASTNPPYQITLLAEASKDVLDIIGKQLRNNGIARTVDIDNALRVQEQADWLQQTLNDQAEVEIIPKENGPHLRITPLPPLGKFTLCETLRESGIALSIGDTEKASVDIPYDRIIEAQKTRTQHETRQTGFEFS